jgi:hypothetical protein
MIAAIGLVTDVVFDAATAIVCAALIGALFAALWFVMPLRRRLSHQRQDR